MEELKKELLENLKGEDPSAKFLKRKEENKGMPLMKVVGNGLVVPFEKNPIDPEYYDELVANGTKVNIPSFRRP
ncbi:hypothetical protein BFP97_17845 [Roseivirga sp. 4D4]|uniref:hypothetical protein n=1 Tax=Roseivirga sp. 4D4 TaxID=1889784 RepID=UPI00085313FE|nr:hypothetical protein [Roseivirga sp. 4D4]OEK03273.1 hypothetical protein BFP97_17845 [Roseivirga sp. 4D4]